MELDRPFRLTEQLVEVSVFLFLIVPSMVLSFFAVKQGSLSLTFVAFGAILQRVIISNESSFRCIDAAKRCHSILRPSGLWERVHSV